MTLREIVAKLAGCSPSEVGHEFSLDRPGLKGSMRRSVLIASIRKHLGVDCMEAASAATFGELDSLVARGPGLKTEERPSKAVSAMPEDLKGNGILSYLRCGIDIESVEMLPKAQDYRNHEFYKGSFSAEEISYCCRQTDPRAHFAARWCAKEALKKSDPALLGEPMSSIEVVRTGSGRLSLRLLTPAGSRDLPHSVSVSHTDALAAAVVVAGPAAWIMRWSWLLMILGLAAMVAAGFALAGRMR